LLTPSETEHYDGYVVLRDSGAKVGYLSGAYCSDISQNPVKRNRSGPLMPTLAKSTVVVNMSSPENSSRQIGGHIYTTNELSFSQGWPAIAYPGNKKYQSCVGANTSSLSWSAQQDLLGNGMVLPALGAWLLYVSGNVVRRDVLQQLAPTLTFHRQGGDVEIVEESQEHDTTPVITTAASSLPPPTLPTPETGLPAVLFSEASSQQQDSGLESLVEGMGSD
jgi:hypothetical protein